MVRRIFCPKCDGSGEGTRDGWNKLYKDYILQYKKEVEEAKYNISVWNTIWNKLSDNERVFMEMEP